MKELLAHFFLPRHSNGHRSKALHFSSLFVYVILVCFLHVGLGWASQANGVTLGYASNINVSDLLKYTNEKRSQNNLNSVVLNGQLSQAAAMKASNMFTEQYWAHTSPSGKDPWSFIHKSGYEYLYAGENLARDFGDSKSVVEAWMNSKSHRENVLNGKYRDIGFAVVNGKYGNYETTLVVQMFGTKPSASASVEAPNQPEKTVVPPVVESNKPDFIPESEVAGQSTEVLEVTPKAPIGIFSITKIALLSLGMFLVFALVLDAFVVYKKKAVRVSGHNFAHFLLLLATIATLILVKRGAII